MVKVKTLISFIDLQEGITRAKDKDIFEVSEERADELIKKGLVELADKEESKTIISDDKKEKKSIANKTKKTKVK